MLIMGFWRFDWSNISPQPDFLFFCGKIENYDSVAAKGARQIQIVLDGTCMRWGALKFETDVVDQILYYSYFVKTPKHPYQIINKNFVYAFFFLIIITRMF